MEPVTVGGLDHQVFRFRNGLGVVDDGLVGVAHVAAENDFPGFLALGQPQFNGGRAQQMSRVVHPEDDALGHLENLLILAGPQQPDGGLRVVHVIDRLHRGLTCPFRLPALPLGLGLLNVGAVQQHNPAQVTGGLGGVDGSGEAVLAQLGQHTRMVNMGMGQEHRLNLPRVHRQGHILENIRSLLHTAVHQIEPASHLQQGAAAGDLMGGADELNFHTFTSENMP